MPVNPLEPTPTLPSLPINAEAWEKVSDTLMLPPQQKRLVELVLMGKRDKEIAAHLHVGLPTVRTYLGRVFQRAGVQDRVELILHVVRAAQSVKLDISGQ